MLNYSIKIQFDNMRDIKMYVLVEGEAVANISAWLVLDEIQINDVIVQESYRRKGIASAMLENLFNFGSEHNCSKITLEVRAGNIPARKLYEKKGFKQVGLRENYYQDNNENAILMDANLKH